MTKARILNYRFEDHKNSIGIIVLLNLMFAFIFILSANASLFHQPRAWICLISGGAFVLLKLLYHWTSVSFNFICAGLYATSVILELFFWGIPERPVDFHRGFSKGAMLDLFIGLMPYIYVGLRLLSISPLINVISSSHQLQKYFSKTRSE
ncbi:MAG: hypothetical protein AAF705_20720 [Bacteroidota bacterium]